MRIPAAIALGLLLAACGDKSDEDDERTASGQVLEGTISDSMLPLDTVRSQPPRAVETGAASDGATPDPDATDAAEEGDSPAEDEAAPADDAG